MKLNAAQLAVLIELLDASTNASVAWQINRGRGQRRFVSQSMERLRAVTEEANVAFGSNAVR